MPRRGRFQPAVQDRRVLQLDAPIAQLCSPGLGLCRKKVVRRGLPDGLGMLLAQAARQFELWTGIYPEPFEQLVDFGRARDGGAF